jgi:hypothetical protein
MPVTRPAAQRRSHPRPRAWLCLWGLLVAVLVLSRSDPVAADAARPGWSAGTLHSWPPSTLSPVGADALRPADAPATAPQPIPHVADDPATAGSRPSSGAPGPVPLPDPRALAIEAVRVRLSVHRAGERLPTGERSPRGGGMVDGEAVYQLTRPARAGERLVLLNYAAVMPREPIELDEVAVSTYIDGPFHAGRLDLLDHQGTTAVRRIGERGDLELELRAGETEIRLAYRVTVPHRYWPFGCSRRRCSLAGAIAPLPSVRAQGGPGLPPGRVVDPVRWTVEDLRFATAPTWSPGQVPTVEEREQLGGDELLVTREAVGSDGRLGYPSVFWGPRWRRAVQTYRGVQIEVLHTLWRPADQVPAERRAQIYRDVPGQVLKVVRETLDVARAAGMEAPVGSKVTVVQGPLRTNIAEFHPTAVMLSDQFLQLWPGKRFLQFHTAVVARASLDLQTYGRMVGRHDPSTDLWAHGMLTMALLDVWRLIRAQGDEYVSDIFRKFTFVPAVDNFLYSGQATFAAAYFRGSDDVMPVRVHPLFFSHELPTGRRLHEKLDDIMTPSQRAQIYIGLVADPDADPRRLAEQTYGHRLDWFFDQWLAPHPDVDYSVRDIKTAQVGGRYRHRITIGRDGERPLLEPVQVMARERGGKQHFLVWNGDDESRASAPIPGTASHTFTLLTDQPLKAVTVDPRARLNETALAPRANVDPLFNNRSPPSARFVYTGVGLEVSASEFSAAQTSTARLQAVSGRVLFEGSQRRNLRTSGNFQILRDRESSAAVASGLSLWFGDKINRRRRRARVRMIGELQYLNVNGLDKNGGLRVNETIEVIEDTRKFALWPDRGRRLSFGVSAGQTLRLDGSGDRRYSLSVGGSWVQLWPIAHQHILASRVDVAVMAPLGGPAEYRSLLRVGGLSGLGAYSGNEIFGRAMALAQLEYRHVFMNNLDVNLLHLGWLRGFGGALFTGVATVAGCDDLSGWFGKGSYYGQVGYGVTAFLQLLGVTPQLLRLDVAVPLVRHRTQCLGHTHPDYLGEVQGLQPGEYTLPPVGLNLIFLQPF